MIVVSEISLKNFRCHQEYKLSCIDDTTLILGKNGCGKTSVLEAIYIAFCGKSFRASDKDILMRDKEMYKIEIKKSDGEKYQIVYDGDKKTFLIKDKKNYRLPKDARYPVILFLPSDLNLTDASPSKKRDYFDRIISQIDDKYSTLLSRYNKAIKQRNELLKQGYASSQSVFSWNILLAKYGVEIRNQRKQIIQKINTDVTEVYRSIAKNSDKVKILYDSYIGDIDESKYLKMLDLDFERDKLLGHTSFGIHKDDYGFVFNGAAAEKSASRGETRSLVLALKFIEADLIYKTIKKQPIVLLDDVFSELDETRRRSLVDNFKNHQVILTSVESFSLEG